MSTRPKPHNEELGGIVSEAVQTLGADLAKTTYDAGEALRRTRSALNSKAQAAMSEVTEDGVKAVEGLKSQVRQHPMTYVAAAAGIGLLAGFLLRRR